MRPQSLILSFILMIPASFSHAENGTVVGFHSEVKEAAALKSANAWLALIDAGDFGATWKLASDFFRSKISEADWISTVNQVRKPLGKLASRKVISKVLLTKLPGAPAGEYVIIQFKADYENKKGAIETITPVFENKDWRVSGYYIR